MDVMEAVKAWRNVTKFKPTPVPEETVRSVFGAVRLAPSVDNAQPWKFVLVTDEELKAKLAAAANNQKWIAEAPIVVVALALLDQAHGLVGGYIGSYPVDVAFAIDHLLLAAAAHELGAAYVNGFDEERVRALIGAPQETKVVGIVPLGYPAEVPARPGSKNVSDILAYNRYE